MKKLMITATVVALAAACYPADSNGACRTPTEDQTYDYDGRWGEPQFWCFDNGDGYPTIYNSPSEPVVYPTVTPGV